MKNHSYFITANQSFQYSHLCYQHFRVQTCNKDIFAVKSHKKPELKAIKVTLTLKATLFRRRLSDFSIGYITDYILQCYQ